MRQWEGENEGRRWTEGHGNGKGGVRGGAMGRVE